MTDDTERDAVARVLWAQDADRGKVLGHFLPAPGRGDIQVWAVVPFERLTVPNRWTEDADAVLAWMRENGYEKREVADDEEFAALAAKEAGYRMIGASDFAEKMRSELVQMAEWARGVTEVRAAFATEPVVVDDATVKRALREWYSGAWAGGWTGADEDRMRRTLAAALTPDGQEKTVAEPEARDEKRELWEAIAALESDYAHGTYSGDGYHYIEATPEALRTVLDSIRSHPWLPANDAQVLRDFAGRVRAQWAPETCPWVGALDDEADRIEKGNA